MKPFKKSISSLNDLDFNQMKNNLNLGIKFSNETLNIKSKKRIPFSLNLKTKIIFNSNKTINKKNSLSIDLLKNPILKSKIMRKTRNNTMNELLNQKYDVGLYEKFNQKNNEQETLNNQKNKFLLLTSLYRLPKIKEKKKINKKLCFKSHLQDTNKNEFYTGINNSIINNKSIFNDSLTTSNDKSTFNHLNILYSNESKMSKGKNLSLKKKRLLSTLSSLMKNKYYIDTEKALKNQITIKSFPSDYSLKDKVIHMKKVGIFWDSVFKYCVPIINVEIYKAQRDLSERKKMDYSKLIKSKSNYYEFMKGKNNYTLRKERDGNKSQLKINSSRIIN